MVPQRMFDHQWALRVGVQKGPSQKPGDRVAPAAAAFAPVAGTARLREDTGAPTRVDGPLDQPPKGPFEMKMGK